MSHAVSVSVPVGECRRLSQAISKCRLVGRRAACVESAGTEPRCTHCYTLRHTRAVFSDFLRPTACNDSRVLAMVEASLYVSVCLSVTLCDCFQTVQAIGSENFYRGLPRRL